MDRSLSQALRLQYRLLSVDLMLLGMDPVPTPLDLPRAYLYWMDPSLSRFPPLQYRLPCSDLSLH